MNIEQFYKTLEDPRLLTADTLSDISDLVAEHPFFQAGWMLMLKNLHNIGDVKYATELKRGSVHISNRRALHKLIHAKPEAAPAQPAEQEEHRQGGRLAEEQPDNGGYVIEAFDFDQPASPYELTDDEVVFTENDSCTFSNWLDYLNNKPDDEEPAAPKTTNDDLISSFLNKQQHSISAQKVSHTADAEKRVRESEKENDDIFTETLASIYIKQKQYAKAINIFEKLSLKNPEKSAYFASRISELRKLND